MIVIVERDGIDDSGYPIEGAGVEHRGVIEWPSVPSNTSSNERASSYTAATTSRMFMFRPGADVRRGDTLATPSGHRWHVVGEPFDWISPFTGTRPGLMVEAEGVS